MACLPPMLPRAQSFRATGLVPHALEELQSIWEWEPTGDDASSGAWHVLRQLAVTANKCALRGPRADGRAGCRLWPMAACAVGPRVHPPVLHEVYPGRVAHTAHPLLGQTAPACARAALAG